MGTYYAIYAEVRVNNKWYNLNPLLQREDGRLDVCPVISGRNWLRETYEELEESQYFCGRPDDISKEVKTVFHHDDEEPYDAFLSINTYKDFYSQSMFVVNYGKSVKSRVKGHRSTRYRGYVSKISLAAYEIDEYDTIGHWLTTDEYEKLSEKEKKSYTYYEWNEPEDWYGVYNIIASNVDCMLRHFGNWAERALDCNYDESHPTADFVRLIVFRC